MTTIVELREVSVEFRRIPVLRDVNLTLERGGSYAVEGPNGSGKSVLFRVLAGLLAPTSGTTWIADDFRRKSSQFPQSFGVLIDRPGYLANRTGLDNLRSLAAIQHRIGDAEIVAAMERVCLDPGLTQKVGAYSLGMKQKLALAQSFMEGQQVLILDEPFNALDATSVAMVTELLAEFVAEGRTLVFSSHHGTEIESLAQHRYLIDGGTLLHRR